VVPQIAYLLTGRWPSDGPIAARRRDASAVVMASGSRAATRRAWGFWRVSRSVKGRRCPAPTACRAPSAAPTPGPPAAS
jgi:hypothetical protein